MVSTYPRPAAAMVGDREVLIRFGSYTPSVPIVEVNTFQLILLHLVPLVRAGATFINGQLVERPDDQDQQEECKQRKSRRSTGIDYSSSGS